ncbi:hypothetical protein SH584_09490 [Sphingomonas sp. LY29]|uniref:hypothetical protein n=1 Tax=Sphingomonas sp. LY29 TaxID=3095341 RepID=UPI002D775F65|nr:hypothetical protein [Sphingomonas sp. LY29]WRP25276.1 hypothetical protein SH584_09490 [Sphingomonas sp. LY29]
MPSSVKSLGENIAETDRASKVEAGPSWSYAFGRALQTCDFTKISPNAAYTNGTFAVVRAAPKVAEINRQVERLRHAKEFAEASGLPCDFDGLVSSIQLLQHLVSGPVPVPVASWDADGGPSLFISEEGFYGDLEINGKVIEYLLKIEGGQGSREIYDSEEIEEGRIPPRLLTHLFAKFAKSNAYMP